MFRQERAADPALDFTLYAERCKAPHAQLFYNLSDFPPNKELALLFHFDVYREESRVLVHSNAGQLADETLHVGDNQFLMEIGTTDAMHLYFTHVNRVGRTLGGVWYFRGVTGYVV